MLIAIVTLGILTLLIGRWHFSQQAVDLVPPSSYRSSVERKLWNAVNRNLSTSSGEIYRVQPSPTNPAQSIARLSESVGLLMMFAVKAQDRRLFEQQVQVLNTAYVRHHLIAWEMIGDRRSPVNSTIDDLRILAAMVMAEKQFDQPSLASEVQGLALGLQRHDADSGWLLNSATIHDLHPKDAEVAVRYWNVSALEALAHRVPSYRRLARDARLGLVHASNRFGWFALGYNLHSHTYQFGGKTGLNMDDELMTALHAQAAEISVTKFLTALQRLWTRHGIIPLRVSSEGRILGSGVSPAIYAMAVRLFWNADQFRTAMAIARVLLSMQEPPSRPQVGGGFSAIPQGLLYSFTQLEVLLTLQEVPIGH